MHPASEPTERQEAIECTSLYCGQEKFQGGTIERDPGECGVGGFLTLSYGELGHQREVVPNVECVETHIENISSCSSHSWFLRTPDHSSIYAQKALRRKFTFLQPHQTTVHLCAVRNPMSIQRNSNLLAKFYGFGHLGIKRVTEYLE